LVSKRSDGGSIDESLQKKVMATARVPEYITKYAKDRKITISELIEAGFDRYREQDQVHASERLRYHEECVLHWRGIVLQNDHSCNTKLSFCNTVRKEFQEQGRGHPSSKSQDKIWLQPRVKKGQAEGLFLTVDELYDFCVKPDKNNGGSKK
jgi:hypothetical protein